MSGVLSKFNDSGTRLLQSLAETGLNNWGSQSLVTLPKRKWRKFNLWPMNFII